MRAIYVRPRATHPCESPIHFPIVFPLFPVTSLAPTLEPYNRKKIRRVSKERKIQFFVAKAKNNSVCLTFWGARTSVLHIFGKNHVEIYSEWCRINS